MFMLFVGMVLLVAGTFYISIILTFLWQPSGQMFQAN